MFEALKSDEILEKHNLVMVLEPLNWWSNHAGQFLTEIPQAYKMAKQWAVQPARYCLISIINRFLKAISYQI